MCKKLLFGFLSPLRKIFLTRYNYILSELYHLSATYAGIVQINERTEIAFYFPLTVKDVITENNIGLCRFYANQSGIFCSFNENAETKDRFRKMQKELDNRDAFDQFNEGLRQIGDKARKSPYHLSIEFAGSCDQISIDAAFVALKTHFCGLKENLNK